MIEGSSHSLQKFFKGASPSSFEIPESFLEEHLNFVQTKKLFAKIHFQVDLVNGFLQFFYLLLIELSLNGRYHHRMFLEPLPLPSGIGLGNPRAQGCLSRIAVYQVFGDKL